MEYFTQLVAIMKEVSDKHGFWKVMAVILIAIFLWQLPSLINAFAELIKVIKS